MATSKSFECDLPDLTEDQLAKLYEWGKSSCEAFDVRMNAEDMSMVLFARREKSGIARYFQRLLRTNLLN